MSLHRIAQRALGLVALSLVGCGYTEMHEVPLRAASMPTGRHVEIYVASQRPPRPFVEIALLQAVGHGADANLADVVKALTTRAAMLGCDAVIRMQVDQGYSMAHGFAVCAKWAVPSAAAPPSAPPPVMEPESVPDAEPEPAVPEGTSL